MTGSIDRQCDLDPAHMPADRLNQLEQEKTAGRSGWLLEKLLR
ncbi:MAG: hypothetical protein ACP5QR_11560 [Rhizomicrobium sp.]